MSLLPKRERDQHAMWCHVWNRQPCNCADVEPHRINIDGGLRIGADGSYSSEYELPLIHAKLADELVRMEHRRNVILAFRSAHDFPKGSRSS